MTVVRLVALLVLVVYPVTELVVAAVIAAHVGWGAVLTVCAVGLIAGVMVMRHAGRRAAQGLAEAARAGSLPGGDVGDSVLLFLAGLLLAVPGLLTDLLGLALLVPVVRRGVRALAGRRVGRRMRAQGFSVTTGTVDGVTVTRLHEGDVIAGEVVDRHDEPGPPTGPDTALPPA